MEQDLEVLNSRWLAHTGPRRVALLAEVAADAAAWHGGVGLSQSNSVASPMGEAHALSFARATGRDVVAYTAVDHVPLLQDIGATSAATSKRRSVVPITSTTLARLEDEVAHYNLRECKYTNFN